MKKKFTFLPLLLSLSISLGNKVAAADSTFIDYQNYNHGYCPECSCYPCRCDVPYYAEPVPVSPAYAPPPPPLGSPPPDPCPVPDPCDSACDPCAPTCGTECGLTICTVGVVIVALAATAAIVISSGEGDPDNAHAH
ncbi:MAG: hypothetical protein WAM28_07700 [Chlamydiales bacterium]